jgi:large subunit ribosomal protein L10
MAKADRTAAIAEIADLFRESGAAVLTEYRGLTVAQLSQLRSSIREHATYAVVKNTLTEKAAQEAGILDGKPLSTEEITKLADLESREVLLAKMAGALKGSLTKAAYLFVAPLSQTARVVEALRQKREEQGPATEAPAAEATTDVAEGGDES